MLFLYEIKDVKLLLTLVALVQSGRHGMKCSRIFKSDYFFTFGALRLVPYSWHKRSQYRADEFTYERFFVSIDWAIMD